MDTEKKTAFIYDGGSELSYSDGVNSITKIVQEAMVGVKINDERVHSGGATTIIAKKNPDGTHVTSYDMQLDLAIKSVIRYFLSIIELDYHSDINHSKMIATEETIIG